MDVGNTARVNAPDHFHHGKTGKILEVTEDVDGEKFAVMLFSEGTPAMYWFGQLEEAN